MNIVSLSGGGIIVYTAIRLDEKGGGRRTMLLYSTSGITVTLSVVAVGHFTKSVSRAESSGPLAALEDVRLLSMVYFVFGD